MSAELSKVQDVVRKAAVRRFGADAVQDVQVTEGEGFLGEEILRARIVLPRRRLKISGDALFDVLGSVTRSVKKLGEARRVILEYADIAELEEFGDH